MVHEIWRRLIITRHWAWVPPFRPGQKLLHRCEKTGVSKTPAIKSIAIRRTGGCTWICLPNKSTAVVLIVVDWVPRKTLVGTGRGSIDRNDVGIWAWRQLWPCLDGWRSKTQGLI